MLKKQSIFLLALIILTSICYADDNDFDKFQGIWCVDAQNNKNDDFLILKKIGNNYLVITAFTDDDRSQKAIANIKSEKVLEVVLRGNKYTLKWDKDGDEEWIEMYIDPKAEDYPYFERVENFSIDKF